VLLWAVTLPVPLWLITRAPTKGLRDPAPGHQPGHLPPACGV